MASKLGSQINRFLTAIIVQILSMLRRCWRRLPHLALPLSLLLGTAAASADAGLSVMAFNVENLFDIEDDPNHLGDQTYLPIEQKNTPAHARACQQIPIAVYQQLCRRLDWDAATLAAKLDNIAAVLDSVPRREQPAIVVLNEIENRAVLQQLNRRLQTPYPTLINLDTSAGRGIDVGLLSHLPLYPGRTATAHRIVFTDPQCKVTRDLLEVTLTLADGSPLTVFGVHFPSPFNPNVCRRQALQKLTAVAQRLPKHWPIIALGDFNFNCTREHQFVLREFRSFWRIPPVVSSGCWAPGSYLFFPRDGGVRWSFLDFIMVNRALAVGSKTESRWFADLGSFTTWIGTAAQIEADRHNRIRPRRFNPRTKTGVSDHWPVMLRLLRR